MAHFAQLDENNIVTRVIVIDDSVLLDPNDPDAPEDESLGLTQLNRMYGDGSWKQTSYNNNIRKKYACIGDTYNESLDAFVSPQPFASWTLDNTEKEWVAPLTKPTLTDEQQSASSFYDWDEDAYQADNTTGWILVPSGTET